MEINTKELQEPFSVEEQIENLKEKNLEIKDVEYAKDFLNRVSYFRFIKAYSLGLKQKNGDYSDGVTFNQLTDLYDFNTRLRQMIFPLAEYIEITLRCKLSNFISQKYGCLGYENPDNFRDKDIHKDFIDELNHVIENNKKNPFVQNFQTNYKDGKIPFYAVIELFSFGMLSKFYNNLNNPDKKIIAREYFGIGYTYFESWIESISYVRNICAHYGRLYNVKLVKSPSLYKQYHYISNYRIFAVILAMKYLISGESMWLTFKNDLIALIERYDESIKHECLGFPDDWRILLIS